MAKSRKNIGGRTGGPVATAPAPGADAAAPGAGKNQGNPPAKSTARATFDMGFALVGALAAALAVKSFIFDVYKIPSGSMEPAIHGREPGGDRVLCLKFPYRFRAPRRWEMAVFRFPHESAIAKLQRETERRRQEGLPAPRFSRASLDENAKQIFIKRIVGLPGETVAIARGDLWVDRADGRGFVRPDKDRASQDDIWAPVHDEDFDDLSTGELAAWWKSDTPGAWSVEGGRLRAAPAGEEAAKLAYRPRMRKGEFLVADLRGVPDRVIRRQPVRFHCRPEAMHPYEPSRAPDDPEGRPGCGARFLKTIRNTQYSARCPGCGAYLMEDAAEFYHLRAGIPVTDYKVWQGEGNMNKRRYDPVHLVPDLRLKGRMRVGGDAWAGVEFHDESPRGRRAVTLRWTAAAGGKAEIAWREGDHAPPPATAAAPVKAGEWIDVDCQVVDGRARLYFGAAPEPLLEVSLDRRGKPAPGEVSLAGGVALLASGGELEWERVILDRDVYYYSGLELANPLQSALPLVADKGEIRLKEDEYLFFGDNASQSLDARTFGGVPEKLLYGPAVWMWWPPFRAHVLP